MEAFVPHSEEEREREERHFLNCRFYLSRRRCESEDSRPLLLLNLMPHDDATIYRTRPKGGDCVAQITDYIIFAIDKSAVSDFEADTPSICAFWIWGLAQVRRFVEW